MRVICAWCPAVIRDDSAATVLEVSHGICPGCVARVEADARLADERHLVWVRIQRCNADRAPACQRALAWPQPVCRLISASMIGSRMPKPTPVCVSVSSPIPLLPSLVDLLCEAVRARGLSLLETLIVVPAGRLPGVELSWQGCLVAVGPVGITGAGDLTCTPEPCEATTAPEVIEDE